VVIIGLGANLASGPGGARKPADTLREALRQLAETHAVEDVRTSRFYRTPAWPDPADPPFVNAIASVKTRLEPLKFLETLHATERAFGRVRSTPNAPRTLDLDLLDYDGLIQQGPPELPHPRMTSRAFVLVPLRDIAPDWRDPVSGESLSELLAKLPPVDRMAVEPIP
jgi:2-amino-4-hydroxy-6-hydroxymethyldihydropteridine diphosphokinase